MKKCPKCGLNWIKDNEESCAICMQDESSKAKIPTHAELNSAIVKTKLLEGKSYIANTHAEFLNTVFETNYIQWMQAGWHYSPNVLVWMVRFYGDDGNWKNRFLDPNTICERYIGTTNLHNGHLIGDPAELYRIVVSISEQKSNRIYTIKGLYKYVKEQSSPHKHIYIKVTE